MELRDHVSIHVAEGGYIVQWVPAYTRENTEDDAITQAGVDTVSIATSIDEVCGLVRRALEPLCGGGNSFDPPRDGNGNYRIPTR